MKKKIITFIAILVIIIIISFTILVLCRYFIFPKKYENIVNQAAKKYNVDPNLVYAIIKQESKFNKKAVSKSGAKGLMQIVDSTADDMVTNIPSINPDDYDIYDPYTNIFIGTKYISYLIDYFEGNYYLAIIAYNAGMGNIQKWIDKPYYRYTSYTTIYSNVEYIETKNYLTNVITYYNFYSHLYY